MQRGIFAQLAEAPFHRVHHGVEPIAGFNQLTKLGVFLAVSFRITDHALDF